MSCLFDINYIAFSYNWICINIININRFFNRRILYIPRGPKYFLLDFISFLRIFDKLFYNLTSTCATTSSFILTALFSVSRLLLFNCFSTTRRLFLEVDIGAQPSPVFCNFVNAAKYHILDISWIFNYFLLWNKFLRFARIYLLYINSFCMNRRGKNWIGSN